MVVNTMMMACVFVDYYYAPESMLKLLYVRLVSIPLALLAFKAFNYKYFQQRYTIPLLGMALYASLFGSFE